MTRPGGGGKRRRAVRAAALTLGLVLVGPANPCGLEDPSSIASRRGALQLAYPNALHVGTAVWQAQLAGELPRDALAQRDDLAPEARAQLRLVKANVELKKMAVRLSGPAAAGRPALSVVLLGPVLWSRFESRGTRVDAAVHVAGPEPGDVVMVTDTAVVEAIAGGAMSFGEALDRRVMRLYGAPEAVAAVGGWLAREH